jgi:hypothetical protein
MHEIRYPDIEGKEEIKKRGREEARMEGRRELEGRKNEM